MASKPLFVVPHEHQHSRILVKKFWHAMSTMNVWSWWTNWETQSNPDTFLSPEMSGIHFWTTSCNHPNSTINPLYLNGSQQHPVLRSILLITWIPSPQWHDVQFFYIFFNPTTSSQSLCSRFISTVQIQFREILTVWPGLQQPVSRLVENDSNSLKLLTSIGVGTHHARIARSCYGCVSTWKVLECVASRKKILTAISDGIAVPLIKTAPTDLWCSTGDVPIFTLSWTDYLRQGDSRGHRKSEKGDCCRKFHFGKYSRF